MVSLRGRHKRTPIALDIGASGIRAVQLIRSGDRHVVASAACCECQPNGSMDGDAVRQSAGHIEKCLRMVVFRGRRAVVALNPPTVEFHSLELPPTVLENHSPETVRVVRHEVERLANSPSDSVETGHWALPSTQVSAPNAIGVAAPNDILADMLRTCSKAGLECVRIDTGPTALARFAATLTPIVADAVCGVLDVGYDEARLVLCVGDVPVLVRRAGPGGRAWTERIADSLQLSARAAEVHKREHGIALTRRVGRRAEDAAPGNEIASILLGVLRSQLKDLASEIKRSYEYVLSCYPGRDVRDLVLVGGGAAMGNLPEYLGEALGITVRRASDYIDSESCRLCHKSRERQKLEALASAIGLAAGS